MRARAALLLLLVALGGCASLEGRYDHKSGEWVRSENEESFWVVLGMAARIFGPAVNH